MKADDPKLSGADVDPLRQQLFEAYDAWLMRQCRQRYDERAGRWQRDYSSQEAYSRSVAPNRERLLEMIGGWRLGARATWKRASRTDRHHRFLHGVTGLLHVFR